MSASISHLRFCLSGSSHLTEHTGMMKLLQLNKSLEHIRDAYRLL